MLALKQIFVLKHCFNCQIVKFSLKIRCPKFFSLIFEKCYLYGNLRRKSKTHNFYFPKLLSNFFKIFLTFLLSLPVFIIIIIIIIIIISSFLTFFRIFKNIILKVSKISLNLSKITLEFLKVY